MALILSALAVCSLATKTWFWQAGISGIQNLKIEAFIFFCLFSLKPLLYQTILLQGMTSATLHVEINLLPTSVLSPSPSNCLGRCKPFDSALNGNHWPWSLVQLFAFSISFVVSMKSMNLKSNIQPSAMNIITEIHIMSQIKTTSNTLYHRTHDYPWYIPAALVVRDCNGRNLEFDHAFHFSNKWITRSSWMQYQKEN